MVHIAPAMPIPRALPMANNSDIFYRFNNDFSAILEAGGVSIFIDRDYQLM